MCNSPFASSKIAVYEIEVRDISWYYRFRADVTAVSEVGIANVLSEVR
jgi:hypothetical protein